MKNTLYLILSLFIIGCTLNKTTRYEPEKINCSIIEINNFEYVFRLKGINSETNDTIYILSFKENMYDKYKYKKPQELNNSVQIRSGNNYKFSLIKKKIQVSNMQELGQYIIVEKDTLWKGSSNIIPPKYYIAQKTMDLTLYR